MFEGLSVFVLVVVAVVVFYLLRAIRMVPQGYEYTVERFGRYVRTLQPGLGLIVPFIDRIGAKQNMMEQVLDIPSQEVITRDNAMVKVDGIAFYQIMDAPRAAYEVHDLNNAIINLVMTNIRTVMGSMDLDNLLSQRDEINRSLLIGRRSGDPALGRQDEPHRDQGHLAAARSGGIHGAPDEGRARQARRHSRGRRPARRPRSCKAEGEKQSVVLEAEGRREAAFRDAEARERSAEAEAKATEMVSNAIATGDVQAINYFVANNYIKALEALATSPNQKVLMLPVEAASVIGSIGGIAEIATRGLRRRPQQDAIAPDRRARRSGQAAMTGRAP